MVLPLNQRQRLLENLRNYVDNNKGESSVFLFAWDTLQVNWMGCRSVLGVSSIWSTCHIGLDEIVGRIEAIGEDQVDFLLKLYDKAHFNWSSLEPWEVWTDIYVGIRRS